MSCECPDFTGLIKEANRFADELERDPGPSLSQTHTEHPAAPAVITQTRAAGIDIDDRATWPAEERQRIWVSARESCASTAVAPDWIIEGYVARGAITELSAKPKVGKTHFTLDAVRATLDGEDFLERPTLTVPVLYLTEEREATFTQALKRVGLDQTEDLSIIYRYAVRGRSWPEIGAEVLAVALEIGAGLVVCDTLPDWASLSGDAENNSGAALEAMRPLQELAAAKLAVLVLRHERKSGGELGDAARGSSAFAGAADVLVTLRRRQGQAHPNQRELAAVGRFSDIPPRRYVELDGSDHYVDLGDDAAVARKEALRICWDLLPTSSDEAVPMERLEAAAEGSCSRPTLVRVLRELEAEQVVSKARGAGSASNRQFGYWLSREASVHQGEGV